MPPSPSERRGLVLQAQAKPVRLTKSDLVAESPMVFSTKIPTFSSSLRVFRQDNKQLVYEMRSKLLSGRYNVHSPDDRIVLSVKKKTFGNDCRVYQDVEKKRASFIIGVKKPSIAPSIVFLEFQDCVSGDACRLLVEGNFADHVAVVYLERTRSALSPLHVRDNHTGTQYQAIGRFYRPPPGKKEIVEAAVGVDATALLLLWLVRHQEMELQSGGRGV